MEMIDRDTEKSMNLRRMERHREDPIGSRSCQQVGDQTATDRNARRVLFVGSRIGIVRDHGRDPRGGGAPGGIEHQQEFDQMVLDGRTQRLDEEHILLAAIRLQLHLDAVI
jgi:hypothetical protein